MNRLRLVHLAVIVAVAALGARPAAAQTSSANEVSQERAQPQNLPPVDNPGFLRRTVTWLEGVMGEDSRRARQGFYPELGGMIPGAGWLAAGPGYRHHVFGDAAVVDVSAAMSLRRYAMAQSRIEWPALFSDRLSIGFGTKYQDFTRINYFGIGPDTNESAQTDYRLKSVDISGSGTIRPIDWLSIGGRIGYIHGLAIAAGLGASAPPTHLLFDDATAPGLAVRPRYGRADLFVEADTRDAPGYPTRGGLYRLGSATFHDVEGSGHSFRRVDADATQYVPVIGRKWTVAMRGRVALSQTSGGNEVPFYLMPTLGGRSTLRAYDDFRFRDRNAAFVSVESRWAVFPMVDAALFVDAGRVAPTAGDLWRGRPEHDYGLGLRFHTASRSFARVDVARGREGTRVALSVTTSFGGSSHHAIPYVP